MTQQIVSLYPDLPNARWVAVRLLDGDQRIREAFQSGELEALARRVPATVSPGAALRPEPAR